MAVLEGRAPNRRPHHAVEVAVTRSAQPRGGVALEQGGGLLCRKNLCTHDTARPLELAFGNRNPPPTIHHPITLPNARAPRDCGRLARQVLAERSVVSAQRTLLLRIGQVFVRASRQQREAHTHMPCCRRSTWRGVLACASATKARAPVASSASTAMCLTPLRPLVSYFVRSLCTVTGLCSASARLVSVSGASMMSGVFAMAVLCMSFLSIRAAVLHRVW